MREALSRLFGVLLVTIQLGALLYLALTGRIIADSMPLFLLQLFGVYIALAALWRISGSPWLITPDLHPRARLITSGIYRRIRHPMYASLMIIAYTWLADRFSVERAYVYLLLLAVLWLKMQREDYSLKRRFGKPYIDYAKRTKRVIPHVI